MTNVTRQDGQLFYEIFGSGPEVLLAFHGFGQDRTIFKKWASTLESKYIFYAFDLFYHGESHRPFQNLSKTEWQEWLNGFLIQEKIERLVDKAKYGGNLFKEHRM